MMNFYKTLNALTMVRIECYLINIEEIEERVFGTKTAHRLYNFRRQFVLSNSYTPPRKVSLYALSLTIPTELLPRITGRKYQ